MSFSRTALVRRTLRLALACSLLLGSPGIGAYEALAGVHIQAGSVSAPQGVAPVAVVPGMLNAPAGLGRAQLTTAGPTLTSSLVSVGAPTLTTPAAGVSVPVSRSASVQAPMAAAVPIAAPKAAVEKTAAASASLSAPAVKVGTPNSSATRPAGTTARDVRSESSRVAVRSALTTFGRGIRAAASKSGSIGLKSALDKRFDNSASLEDSESPVTADPASTRLPGLRPAGQAVVDQHGRSAVEASPKSSTEAKAKPKLAAALKGTGYLALLVAGLPVLSMMIPGFQIPALFFTLQPYMAGSGMALSLAGKFFQKPAARKAGSQETPGKLPGIIRLIGKVVPSFVSLAKSARKYMSAHRRFEDRVGGGSKSAFSKWFRSAMRTALYWAPAAIAAMVGGAIIATPFKSITLNPEIGATASGIVMGSGWLATVASDLAFVGMTQFLLVGVVYRGGRALLERLGLSRKAAAWLSGAAALALAAFGFSVVGTGNLGVLIPILAIEAVGIYAYERSGTLAVPVTIRLLIELAALYSARMMAFLQAPAPASIAGLSVPGGWVVLAMLGVAAGAYGVLAAVRYFKKHGFGFIKKAVRREIQRLEAVGRWWNKPKPDGSPKALWPMLRSSLFWGVVLNLAIGLAYWGTFAIFPHHEVLPEALKKVIMMPIDVHVYSFMIAAALEEIIFRQGVFRKLRDSLKNRGVSPKWSFWRAAILSSILFSLVHFIPIALPGAGEALAAAYGFSLAGFIGRVAGGLFLVFLYARSKTLILPIIAHFASNTLEVIGLHWGIGWLLGLSAGIMALQWAPRFYKKIKRALARRKAEKAANSV